LRLRKYKENVLSGEWDATATLLENSSLVEKKFKELLM